MKKIKIIVALFILLVSFKLATSTSYAASCTTPHQNPCWITKASMPTARREIGIASDPLGNIYVVGGYDGSNFLNTFEKYNPLSDTWTTLASLPVQRNEMGFAYSTATGKFYSVGGYNQDTFSDVYEYDPITDTWTQKSSMPTARQSFGLVGDNNGMLYAIGGVAANGTAVSAVEEYNPSTDTWSTKTALPTPRVGLGVVTAQNGKIYAIGGHLDYTNNFQEVATVEEYNPITNIWTTKNSMATARSSIAVTVNGQGKIYAIGGNVVENPGTTQPVITNVVEEYSPGKDTWVSRTPLPTATMELGAVLAPITKVVYAIGGWTPDSSAVAINFEGFK